MHKNDKYYEEIKNRIIDVEVTEKIKNYTANRVKLENYYEIGRLIIEAQGGLEKAKYGDGLIKEYSKKLMIEIDKKYSYRNLMYIRKFYIMFKNKKVNALRSVLSWTHYRTLLCLDNFNEIEYYINLSIKQNLNYRELHKRIKNKEYEKLSDTTKNKLIENKKPELIELIKDPIVINNPSNIEVIKEKMLQKLIMENIFSFLKQLGNDYMFVGNEYPIKVGDRYYRVDLLLYNMEYESYVVIELKIGELKKEYISQIEFYMNYIDKNKKKTTQNKTIGIILCHRNNKLIMEYCSNNNVAVREYVLN